MFMVHSEKKTVKNFKICDHCRFSQSVNCCLPTCLNTDNYRGDFKEKKLILISLGL